MLSGKLIEIVMEKRLGEYMDELSEETIQFL